MLAYARDVLEGLFGGFIFCFLGFGTGGGMVKAAHDLRMEMNRLEPSIGVCLVSAAFFVFWGAATVFLFGLPILYAVGSGLEIEPTRLWIKGVFYYVGGGFFIWSFLTKMPEAWENK